MEEHILVPVDDTAHVSYGMYHSSCSECNFQVQKRVEFFVFWTFCSHRVPGSMISTGTGVQVLWSARSDEVQNFHGCGLPDLTTFENTPIYVIAI